MLQTHWVNEPDHPQTLWDRLEEASADIGLPCGLSDVGRELDIWPSAVQKWRDGLNYPAKKNLITLAQNRGINVEWLETGRGQKLAEGAMDAATRELLSIWTKLPKEARERLLAAAQYEKRAQPEPTSPPPAAPHSTPTKRR